MISYIKVKRKKIDLCGYTIFNTPNGGVKVDLIFKNDNDGHDIIGNGFKLYDNNKNLINDFTDCIYQYNVNNSISHGISMTNLNNYKDTPIVLSQKLQSIETLKRTKIAELSETCNQTIICGVDMEINGAIEHFSYDLTDQVNIDDMFNLAISTGLPQSYHCDGGSLHLYEVDVIKQIYVKQKIHKIENITYYNQLKQLVLSSDDIDMIESIKYGDKLSGKYLETYITVVEQYKTTLLSFINK